MKKFSISKKTTLVLIVGVCFIVVAFTLYIILNQDQSEANSYEYVITEAKIIAPQSFEQLDAESEVVIKGTKIGVSEVEFDYYQTISEVRINKIFKDQTNQLTSGKTILVQESAAIQGNRIYSREGYKLMNNEEEYLLFLRPNLTEPNMFTIKGVYYGKVPLEPLEDLQFQGSEGESEELKNIYRAALGKYE
jgi:hypothetical protein